MHEARTYLSRVLPPPGPGRGLCIALAYGRGFAHALCDTLDDAVDRVQAWSARGSVFACLSLQRVDEPTVGGAGLRSQRNAVALKALWLDIDCKTGGYATETEALNAVADAVRATKGMPAPTLVVASGGGLHVYWTLEQELPPGDWQPLAKGLAEWAADKGLLVDRACTADSARVLRVPGTLNTKYSPPMPCKIVLDTGRDVAASAMPVSASARVQQPKPAIIGPANEDLVVDIDIDLDLVSKVCPAIRHAEEHGGEGHDYHAWLPLIWGAAFVERASPGKGRAWAHKLSCNHEDYSPGVVDRALDDALRRIATDKAGMGWPSCAAFAAGTITLEGKSRNPCDGCRFRGMGLGPFSIAHRVKMLLSAPPEPEDDDDDDEPVAASGNEEPALPPPCDDLPPPYERRQRSHGTANEASIWKPPSGKTPWVEVLPFDVRKARLFSFRTSANDFIEFEARPGGSTQPSRVQLEVSAIQRGAAEFRAAMAAQPGGLVTPKDAEARTFFMAWLNYLRTHANVYTASEPPAAYGWVRKHGDVPTGFAFNNTVYTPTTRYQGHSINPLSGVYAAVGDADPWYEAAKLVLDQKRPGLAAIIATAFAGPLLSLLGIKGTVCSAFSAASGVGKTSAMRVAQAVWGQPTLGMQSLSDTEAALLKKAGLLRNLPLFWDELKSRHDLMRFSSAVFQLTHGREKSRATQTGSLAEVVEWDTLLLVAGNDCLVDVMLGQHTNTQAGALRVFEWEVEGDKLTGRAVLEAAAVFKRLDYHYGVIGERYAAFLGSNIDVVRQVLSSTREKLDNALAPTSDERFWVGAATAIVAGALLAEKAELCTFDTDALLAHVSRTFGLLRSRLCEEKAYSDPKEPDGLSNIVAEFLSDHADRTIISPFFVRQGRGRLPRAIELNPLFQPKNKDLMTIRSTQPVAHYACDERKLVVSTQVLSAWLRDKKRLALKTFVAQFPSAERRNRVIGIGTEFSRRIQADTYELDLSNCVEPIYSFDATGAGRSVLLEAVRAAQSLGQVEAAQACMRHYELGGDVTPESNVVPLAEVKQKETKHGETRERQRKTRTTRASARRTPDAQSQGEEPGLE